MALTQTQVSQLYVATFGRASEGEGNAYWQAAGETMASTAEAMLASPAGQEYFGDTLNDNQAFIEFIYENTLGKTYKEDQAGVDYWVGQLAGGRSKGEVIADLVWAASSAPAPDEAAQRAQDQFNNKVAVSDYCAEYIESYTGHMAAFADFINDVDETADSVAAAQAAIKTAVPGTLSVNVGTDTAAGADVMRITGTQNVRIDLTENDNQVEGIDLDNDGVIEHNGVENNNPTAQDDGQDFEIVDAYTRNPLNFSDTGANYLGDIAFDGTGFAGDGVNTDGNIFLGGLGADTALGGIGNDFMAGGGVSNERFERVYDENTGSWNIQDSVTGELMPAIPAREDYLSGGRNADFFFAELSLLDSVDGDSLRIDGGSTSDDAAAGNNTPQDADWLLLEASDDDEPVFVDLRVEGAQTAGSDDTGINMQEIEHVDASGNLYGFLDDVNTTIGGRAGEGHTDGENYGIGSSAQLDIWGSAADNIIIGGFDNDVIRGQAGDDLLFGGRMDYLHNPNLTDIVNDGMDEIYGEDGDDDIVFEADGGIIDGGAGVDTLWVTELALGTQSVSDLTSDNTLRFDLLADNLDNSSGYGGADLENSEDQTNYVDNDNRVTMSNMENIIATGLGAVDYLASGANDPELNFNNQQNIEGYNGNLDLRGTNGVNVLYAASGHDTIEGRQGGTITFDNEGNVLVDNDGVIVGDNRDKLSGGNGNDDFYFGSVEGDGVDVIHRQTDANGDNIWDVDANENPLYEQDFDAESTVATADSTFELGLPSTLASYVDGIQFQLGEDTYVIDGLAAADFATWLTNLETAIDANEDLASVSVSSAQEGLVLLTDSSGDAFVELTDGWILTSGTLPSDGLDQWYQQAGDPTVIESQDRLIYAAYEDRQDGELRDDDSVLGSNISLGVDSYAEDLVISFDADGTRIAEDQSYDLVFENVTTEDTVTITVNGVDYTLTVGKDLDGNSIAAEDGVNDAQANIQDVFLARMANFINTFMDDDTAAGQVAAVYNAATNTLTLTQVAYNGEETVFMSTPTIAWNNASGGEGIECTVVNNSDHEVHLLDFDGRNGELDDQNVLFWGNQKINRAVLETAVDAGGVVEGSDAILIDNRADTHAATVANTGDTIFNNQATNWILDNLDADGDGSVEEIYSVHGDDLLIGGAGDDTITGGTGDDRIIGSLGEDTIDGGKNYYSVQVLGEDTARVYELNAWEAANPNDVTVLDGLTISSITLISQTETGAAFANGEYDDTLQFEQADFTPGATNFKVTLSDFNVTADNVVELRNGGAGTVEVDVDGDGVYETEHTTFTNFENIRTVSGIGKAVAGDGQGNDTLDVNALSDSTGGISYDLTNTANNAGEVKYSKNSANNVVAYEAGQTAGDVAGATVAAVRAAILGENTTVAFANAVNAITIAADTTVASFLAAVADLPELVRPTSETDASTQANVSDYEELVIRVDGVENVIAGDGNDLLMIDETEAAKDNLFDAGLGVDRIEYLNDYNTAVAGAAEPTVTVAVNTALDTDTVTMTSGRVGSTVATDTLVGVEYVTMAGETAQGVAEADVIDVTAMTAGAVVDYTNGEIRTAGSLAGDNVELVVEGITQFENVWADGDDTVIVADTMTNAREDSLDGKADEAIEFRTYLDFDDITALDARRDFNADPGNFAERVVNQGQYTFDLSHGNTTADNDTVDYKAESDIIIAVADFDATVDKQYIIVDDAADGDFSQANDRIDTLVGVENVVASAGESILDLTNSTQDLKITFSSNYDRVANYDADYAEGNGLEVHQISVTGDSVGAPELLEMNYLDYVFVDATPDDATDAPAMQSVYWNRIEGSDFGETVEMSGYEAGEAHTLNLRGGENTVNYEGNKVEIVIDIIDPVDGQEATTGLVRVEATHTGSEDQHDGDQADDPTMSATDVITSYSAQNEVISDNGSTGGSLTIKGARFDNDSIAFDATLDKNKLFILGGVVDATNAITVTIGDEEDANSLLLVGFELLIDAATDDKYAIGDFDNVVGELVLVDNAANDRDTLIAYDDAEGEDGNTAGNVIELAGLEAELGGFDFDVLDLTNLTEDDATVIGDAADVEGLQEIIVGDFDTIDSDAGAGISNFDILSLTDAAGATKFDLDITAGELQSAGDVRFFDFDGNQIDVSRMTSETEITVTDTAGVGATVIGSAQKDEITGGAGDDIINGGAGDDVLDGGSATEIRTIEIEGANVLEADGNFASFNFMNQGNLVLTEGTAQLTDGAGPQAVMDALAAQLRANLTQATLDFQTATGSTAAITDVSSDNGKLTFTFNDGVDVLDAHLIDLGFNANGDTGDLTVSQNSTAANGGTGGDNIFYGGLGVDTITGGGGNDEIVVIGELAAGEYAGAAGAAATLELGDILTAAKAVSDVSTDTYQGGEGVDTLEIWGTADFTNATIEDIEIFDIHSNVTFNQAQLAGATMITSADSVVTIVTDAGDLVFGGDTGSDLAGLQAYVDTIPREDNHAPVAGDDSFTAFQDAVQTINAADLLANDIDADGNVLSITGVSGAMNGTVELSADGSTITFNPTAGYTGPVQFTYTVSDGVETDTATVTGTINPADSVAPTLASSVPADDAGNVAVNADIVLTFSEDVQAGTGGFVIYNAADGSVVETIAAGDAAYAGSTVTINPVSDLANSTDYYVQVAAGAVEDLAGNDYAGISDATSLNFTTMGDVVIEDVAAANATPYNASSADVTFNFTQNAYTYNIDGFGAGDVLNVLDTGAITVINGDGTDGILDITVGDVASGTTLEIQLTGVEAALDGAVFNVSSFNAAFGAGSLG